MADNASEAGTVLDLKHWSDLVPRIDLTPDEDPADFEPLHTALMQDLEPGTPYEKMLAENLVALEWEMSRHRRLRDGLLLTALRQDFMETLANKGGHIIPINDKKRLSSEVTSLLGQIAEDKPSGRAEIDDILKPLNTSLTELVASAYSKASEFIANHENRLAQLEVRRRKLMQDFNALKQTRLKQADKANITDA